MASNKTVWAGLVGTVITAVCCFTPVLVVLLGVLGLGTAVGYLDIVLFPLLAVFVAILVFGLIQKSKPKIQ